MFSTQRFARFCWFSLVFVSSFFTAEVVGVIVGGDHTVATWAVLTGAAGVLSAIVVHYLRLAARPRTVARTVRATLVAAIPSFLAVVALFVGKTVGSIQLAVFVSLGGALNAVLLSPVLDSIAGDSSAAG